MSAAEIAQCHEHYDRLLDGMAAGARWLSWWRQVEPSLAAHLNYRSKAPALLRMLFVEIVGMGPQGLAVRAELNRQISAE